VLAKDPRGIRSANASRSAADHYKVEVLSHRVIDTCHRGE
jgi:hypothetical protein